MNILVPLTITEALLADCNIAEPAAGELEWVSGAAYALGVSHAHKLRSAGAQRALSA